MLTPRQIRAARGLVGWDAIELSEKTKLTRETIANIEAGRTQAREGSLEKIYQVFDAAGVQFIENEGVRLKPSDIETFIGVDRFNEFAEFMYGYLKAFGGEVCVSVTNERLFQKYRKNLDVHRARMKELVEINKVSGRILAVDSEFKETWAKIRRQAKGTSDAPVSFYAFGDCLALISFDHDPAPYVVLHKSGPFAAAYRQAFDAAWEKADTP